MSAKISCLMVTQEGRIDRARTAIGDYLAQTHANKELIIIGQGSMAYLHQFAAYVQQVGRDDLRFYGLPADDASSLGAKRNLALRRIKGAVACTWDDDDRNHPDRLALQLRALGERGALSCALTTQLYYLAPEAALYVMDWGVQPRPRHRLLPATVMWRAEAIARYPETGPFADKGEDTQFLRHLFREGSTALVHEHPWLYTYVFHGGNTWSGRHFAAHVARLALPLEAVALRRDKLEAGLRGYAPPLGRDLAVRGRDGGRIALGVDAEAVA